MTARHFTALRVTQDDNKKIHHEIRQLDMADLPEGEVLIRVSHSSVNYKDALAATGAGRILSHFPMTAGIDLAGEVVESADPDLAPGDPVLVTGCGLGESHDGGYAQYARVPASWVIKRPAGFSAATAMTLGTAGFTAGLSLLRMQHNGQTPGTGPIAVTGASGGVGSIAIALFSSLGYDVTAISGKSAQHARLKALGASEIIDRHTLPTDSRPLEKAQWGGVLDGAGGDMLASLIASTRPWGNVASYGLVANHTLHTTVMPFILRGVNLLGITSANCPREYRLQIWQMLAESISAEHLQLILADTVPLDDLSVTFDRLIAGKAQGRYVVEIP